MDEWKDLLDDIDTLDDDLKEKPKKNRQDSLLNESGAPGTPPVSYSLDDSLKDSLQDNLKQNSQVSPQNGFSDLFPPPMFSGSIEHDIPALFSDPEDSEDRESGSTGGIHPGIMPGIGFGGKKTGSRTSLSAKSDKEAWDASSLILDEKEETPDEEDVQCYMLRRWYSEGNSDPVLDRIENAKPPLVSAWEERPAASLSADELALQLIRHLSERQISDTASLELILMRKSDGLKDPGMRVFYSAFALLQSEPSQKRTREEMTDISGLPRINRSVESISILKEAIANALARQIRADELADRKQQEKQVRLDARQKRALRDYDDAKRRTDRWR